MTLPGENIFARFLCQQLIYGRPRTDIAPADFGRNHKHARRSFRARRGFQDGVVHRDIFDRWTERPQLALRAWGSEEYEQFFPRGARLSAADFPGYAGTRH